MNKLNNAIERAKKESEELLSRIVDAMGFESSNETEEKQEDKEEQDSLLQND